MAIKQQTNWMHVPHVRFGLADQTDAAAGGPGYSRRGIPLAIALGCLLGVIFWSYGPTLSAIWQRWSEDPRYSHGYFVPLLAAIVLWSRRDLCESSSFQPSWWGIPLLAMAAALHLTAAYVYFDWLDAVSLLPCFAGLVVLLTGPAGGRWFWPAILFLIFALPLPYQVEVGLAHPLQRLATLASTYCLQTAGVPAIAEGTTILIDDLRLGVVEACSGLGMLVTFFALATAFALVVRRPLVDKLIIVLSAVPIGVLANVLRISVTGLLLESWGPETAKVVYHDLAGWLMMPLAVGMLWLEVFLLNKLFIEPESLG